MGAAAFMAFFARTVPFASAPTVFIAFMGAAAFMAFLARTVPFASVPTVFIALIATFMAFLARTVPFAAPTIFIAFIAFIAFAMARGEFFGGHWKHANCGSSHGEGDEGDEG